jgi:excisionase family DNA binding protein
MLEKTYSTAEAAKALGISTRTLLQYCREGRITYIRLKGQFRFRESTLKFFIGSNTVPATKAAPISLFRRKIAA